MAVHSHLQILQRRRDLTLAIVVDSAVRPLINVRVRFLSLRYGNRHVLPATPGVEDLYPSKHQNGKQKSKENLLGGPTY